MRESESRDAFPESFRRVNPKMRVPVISLDGEVITEVPAIATAIASLAPEMHLMGRTALDTARVYEWMNWLSGTLHTGGFGHLYRPDRWSADPASFDGVKVKARELITECFDTIEGKLCGRFSTGGAFTAVDLYLFVFYRWGNRNGFDMKAKYPKYTALASNLVLRPAVRSALEAEQIQSTM